MKFLIEKTNGYLVLHLDEFNNFNGSSSDIHCNLTNLVHYFKNNELVESILNIINKFKIKKIRIDGDLRWDLTEVKNRDKLIDRLNGYLIMEKLIE